MLKPYTKTANADTHKLYKNDGKADGTDLNSHRQPMSQNESPERYPDAFA